MTTNSLSMGKTMYSWKINNSRESVNAFMANDIIILYSNITAVHEIKFDTRAPKLGHSSTNWIPKFYWPQSRFGISCYCLFSVGKFQNLRISKQLNHDLNQREFTALIQLSLAVSRRTLHLKNFHHQYFYLSFRSLISTSGCPIPFTSIISHWSSLNFPCYGQLSRKMCYCTP